jgi:hypothetical protein
VKTLISSKKKNRSSQLTVILRNLERKKRDQARRKQSNLKKNLRRESL